MQEDSDYGLKEGLSRVMRLVDQREKNPMGLDVVEAERGLSYCNFSAVDIPTSELNIDQSSGDYSVRITCQH